MDKSPEHPTTLISLKPEDTAFIDDIRNQLNTNDQMELNTRLELLRTTAENYLAATNPGLKNNCGTLFERFAIEIDIILRRTGIEFSTQRSSRDIGAIATRIKTIYENLCGYKREAAFTFNR